MSLEPDSSRQLHDAVLATVAYADIFDFAMNSSEIHRDLVAIGAGVSDVAPVLDRAINLGQLVRVREYLTFAGRESLVKRRIERNQASERMWSTARSFGRIFAALPFVRLVGVTGSLAADNAGSDADIDYLIIVGPNRVWLVRALAIAVVRFARLRGVTLCPNYLLSTNALEIPYHDPYTAHELLQMVPLSGPATYAELLAANPWAAHYLPNRSKIGRAVPDLGGLVDRIKTLGEWAFAGSLGGGLDNWESRRKIARFQAVGTPGRFSRDVCEGHFGHHRDHVLRQWRIRCDQLGVATSLDSESPILPDLVAAASGVIRR